MLLFMETHIQNQSYSFRRMLGMRKGRCRLGVRSSDEREKIGEGRKRRERRQSPIYPEKLTEAVVGGQSETQLQI